MICLKDLTGNATFENGAKTVYARAYCEIPNKTMDNIYTTEDWFYTQYGSYTSLHAETTVPISYINVPAGTYRSGEYVPIVVDFGETIDACQRFVKTDENTKLIVNGTECELLDEPGIYSSYLCFLYKVKDVDSGVLVVESISGLKNKDGEDITLVDGSVKLTEDGKINMTFGAEQGVVIAADVLYDRIDWANTKFGVDENHRTPAVTIVLPLKNVDDNLKTSIANASMECGVNNGLGINMTVPGYGAINVKYYMTNMYFGNNSKKYPVYILTSGEDETPVALIGHFATEPNLKKYVRLDTLYLYMNRSGVVDSSTIPALSEAKTDAFGLPYFNGPGARALGGKVYQYYVAPSVYVDKTKFIERTAAYEIAEGGFIKLLNPEDPDFMYVYPGDPEHPENQYDLELLATEDLYQAQIRGGAIYMDEVPDIRYKALYSSRKDFESKNDFTVEEDSLIIWWWKAIMPYV